MEEWLGFIELIQRELLLFCGIWFVIGALDDIAVDLLWIARRVWLHLRGRGAVLRLATLAPPAVPGTIAVFLPLWDESAVASKMLAACAERWRGQDYHLFAGVYPNDPATRRIVERACAQEGRISLAITGSPGPTTKADCLNRLWRALREFEAARGTLVKAVVLHDAEDLVHADEPALFDRMMETHAFVQLPVRAVPVPGSQLVSGHYRDEFVEAHDKQMVVRGWIGAALPSAGVGCAFERRMLGRIAAKEGGRPFNADSMTEDYELGLTIHAMGGRQTIAHVTGHDGSLICTQSCFPSHFLASARQKARWLTGIALAGWDRMGWTRSPVECWMRLRDRRSIFAALLLLCAYILLALTALLWIVPLLAPDYRPRGLSDEMNWLVLLTLGTLCWRLLVRCWFVARAFGWREALWCPLRLIMGNAIAIAASWRAIRFYIGHCLGQRLRWEKTRHDFPDGVAAFDPHAVPAE